MLSELALTAAQEARSFTELVKKLRAQDVAFEAILGTVSAQHPAIRRFKKSSRETEMLANVTLYLSRP